jgi:hypothetical protein
MLALEPCPCSPFGESPAGVPPQAPQRLHLDAPYRFLAYIEILADLA